MKPFLIVQTRKEDEVSQNEFDAFLKYAELQGKDTTRIRAEKDGIDSNINLDEYSGVILGGGPLCVSDSEKTKSDIKMEQDLYALLDKIAERDFPFLGACLGVGILGNHQGCIISKDKYGEGVGAVTIKKTGAGKHDDLLKGVNDPFRAFVGHKEACQKLSDNAVLLASSDTCPAQMFRVKNNMYATQFHPELDSEGLALRIKVYKSYGYFDPSEADELITKGNREVLTEPMKILHNFVNKYATG